MSMAAISSDLGNRMSGANSQMDSPSDMPSQSAKDLWELKGWGSYPLLLVILVSSQASLVEDMLHDISTGLTEAVVIGPGRVVLFYGRHSLGEGLTTDEARDATFLLTGAGTWVGKLAYLTTDLMTIQEGR